MRLKGTLDKPAIDRARQWAGKQAGLPYDLKFQWGDDSLYCSELVWKLYDQAGVQLCPTRPFRSYNLDAPVVRKIIDQRYGGMGNLPMDEPVVAPGDLAGSRLLVEVPEKPSKKR
jgi:hypothetical protein